MSVATFKLNRPKVANALDLATATALEKALQAAIKAGHHGFIISAGLDKTFCSGGDLKSYSQMKSKAEGLSSHKKIRKILRQFKEKSILIAAAIEGDVLGGGCELALACDFIFTSYLSRFSFRQVAQGLTPGWGGCERLLNRARPSLALDWLTSGRWISAPEGHNAGLIDEVYPRGKVLEATELFLKTRPKELIGTMKALVYSGAKNEDKVFEKLWWSAAHRNAMAATLKAR